MAQVFWKGKLSASKKLLININNLLAWVTGNARDTEAMKQRVRLGYEGAYTDHVTRYDAVGMQHFAKIAEALLNEVDIKGKEVLDVGCGTGITSLAVFQRNPVKLLCGDISEYMLGQCQKRMAEQDNHRSRVDFRQLDAESLPFSNNSFDAAVSGMMLGMVPNQQRAVSELARVTRPSGAVAISTHGPNHNFEAIDASFIAATNPALLAHRLEFWARREEDMRKMLGRAGLTNIKVQRLTWQDSFRSGAATYDFFAVTSSAWWFAKYPPEKIEADSLRVRDYFERKGVRQLTQDVILAVGYKP